MKLLQRAFLFLLIATSTLKIQAQNYYELSHDAELGFTLGVANYFGDINTTSDISRSKIAFGAYYRKQFGSYVAARVGFHYAQLGYSDVRSKNSFQQLRNLSFNTNIWEVAVQGDFNFFKFLPGTAEYRFTPYVSLGVGVFGYNPYAYLQGKKYFLRPLGTEGQNIGFEDRKPYKSTALSFPIGVGIKYNINSDINFTFEIGHRLTNTDYIDDVSTTYIGQNRFVAGTPAFLLQDRSYELAPITPLGNEGRQRGFSKQKDQFLFMEMGISFNFGSYKCPTAN
jgi:hypothetical protein